MTSPFHFPSLVWGGSIAIYLFLLGISAGGTTMVIWLKKSAKTQDPNSLHLMMKTNAWLAPITMIVGLVLLIFHLARPWTFWKLMFHYSATSIMSFGVGLFQVYSLLLGLWLITYFYSPLLTWLKQHFPKVEKLLQKSGRILRLSQNGVENILFCISLSLGAYTGFLLSALISYPMLNQPVLPILFLISGLSSGIAGLVICSMIFTAISPHSPLLASLHKIETGILLTELFLLFCFFLGLYLGDGQKRLACQQAIGEGFWAGVFWLGVVGLGILAPLAMNVFASPNQKHRKSFMLTTASLTLLGVGCLRFFILYAGQMTLA